MGQSVLVVGRGRRAGNIFEPADLDQVRAFYAARPQLAATPLHRLPALASRLGIGELLVKDETARFGLNAFKAAGAMFAVTTLVSRGQIQPGDTLVCASEGNHGRAVARAARDAGCAARVYLSEFVAATRADAIASEGAAIVRVPGTYDDAVRTMAREAAAEGWTVISDTSWDGYEAIPRLIMVGYMQLMEEAAAQWAPADPPHAIFVQAGVGGLLAAVAGWAQLRYGDARPFIVGVEPASAACVQASVRHGAPTRIPGPFTTVMGGLRCGEMSPMTFPVAHTLVDGYVAIEDTAAFEAMRRLAGAEGGDPCVRAGASGAAALGGLMAVLGDPQCAALRTHLKLNSDSRVLVLVTEGITDQAAFDAVVSRG
jgi:diaminopropionate ammonia-lyase